VEDARVMTHPFQHWPRRRRRLALVVLICAAVLPLVLSTATTPLAENEPGGRTIVEFELAGSVTETKEILATWRAAGVVDDAKRIQLFDVIYPLIYCSALAGACVAAAGAWRNVRRPSLAKVGIAMAWVAFAAAVFDYVENVGLAVSLWGHPHSPWPQVSWVAAVLKFATSGSALLYALTGALAWLLARRSTPRARPA
jgi:hypothetical protein